MTRRWAKHGTAIRNVTVLLLFAAATAINLFMVGIGTPQTFSIYAEIRFIAAHPRFSYDEKMQNRWGRYYDLVRFAAENTGPDSAVLLPSSVNLGGINTYFLYPRRWAVYAEGLTRENVVGYDYVLVDGSQSAAVPRDIIGVRQEIAGADNMTLLVLQR
ncbi:MAG: hypothetical protein AAB427_16620 [Chloroflexota bacterium]